MIINCVKVYLGTGNYSRVVATVGLGRLTGHYYSLLFMPLLLVTCLVLLAPWLLPQVLAPWLPLLLSLLVLVFKIWFRATQLPPVQGSSLATDYIDICLACCLLGLGHGAVTRCISPGRHRPDTAGDNFNLVEEVSQTCDKTESKFKSSLKPKVKSKFFK